MKQTAVEWLWEQMDDLIIYQRFIHLLEQAKEMEKEQIKDAYEQGESDGYKQLVINIDKRYESFEQYYKETYERN